MIIILKGVRYHSFSSILAKLAVKLWYGWVITSQLNHVMWLLIHTMISINTLRPRQNGRHFAGDTFNHIFVNENLRISIKFSRKFVPKGPIINIPALVQIMAWRHPGNKPLSEPVMVCLLTHICVTQPQWVNHISKRGPCCFYCTSGQ